ncbi:hypothetical protein [Aurantimonas sp. VKM B-3413]|nr:hypothetical protein [Aurantimonas sp. VKM B-3413]
MFLICPLNVVWCPFYVGSPVRYDRLAANFLYAVTLATIIAFCV